VALPAGLVLDCPGAEALDVAARTMARVGVPGSGAVRAAAHRRYAAVAARCVRDERPRVFHYRAGYGLASADVARAAGIRCLCDHSIAHPDVVERVAPQSSPAMATLWSMVRRDLESGDRVLVNSDYVARTLVDGGIASDRIDVIYSGVDDAFLDVLDALADRPEPSAGAPRELLFAGSLERRKGVDTLVEAVVAHRLDVKVHLVGPATAETESLLRHVRRDERFVVHGRVSRRELAELMVRLPVFVFPSRAEGSARVVFEALAAGMYVVTTEEAGSVVGSACAGSLVPSGDAEALAAAIEGLPDSATLGAHGVSNAAVIRRNYRQATYGSRLRDLYGALTA
jgi:glycosyltransferase involved in cell wall biosynthesis